MEKQNPANIDFEALQVLIDTINARADASEESSYTSSLLKKGTPKCAEKLGEEAVETVIALISGKNDQIIYESADLLYHLLVALKSENISLQAVLSELERREGVSGHAEKASRKQK